MVINKWTTAEHKKGDSVFVIALFPEAVWNWKETWYVQFVGI